MSNSATRRMTVVHNVVHLRAEPRGGSELVSQTLMGRTLDVLKEEGGWAWTQGDDTYRGWADLRWLAGEADAPLTLVTAVFADLRAEPRDNAALLVRLPILASVALGAERDGGWTSVTLPDGTTRGWLPTHALTPLPRIADDAIPATAVKWGAEFRGTPYLWGGSSSFGLDCSGFVQLCYRLATLNLRRDADIQRDDPRFYPVVQDELMPGDLVFFGKSESITHVGMHFAGNTFIHSAGGAGVIVSEWGDDRYSPSYVDARRLDPARAADPITRFEAKNR
jgi:cell wall-associated NlpC family hydrolase